MHFSLIEYSDYIKPIKDYSYGYIIPLVIIVVIILLDAFFDFGMLTIFNDLKIVELILLLTPVLLFYIFSVLAPGISLSNDYFDSDQQNYAELKNIDFKRLENRIKKVEKVSNYISGKRMHKPLSVSSEFWFYNIYLDKNTSFTVSNFLSKKLDWFDFLEHHSIHVYSTFPSIKSKDDFIVSNNSKGYEPDTGLINFYEKRFKNYTEDQLNDILNQDGMKSEAKIAIQNLLNK